MVTDTNKNVTATHNALYMTETFKCLTEAKEMPGNNLDSQNFLENTSKTLLAIFNIWELLRTFKIGRILA